MANPKVRCVAPEGCVVVRTWSDNKTCHMKKGQTISVPPDVAKWLDSLTNFKLVKSRTPKE